MIETLKGEGGLSSDLNSWFDFVIVIVCKYVRACGLWLKILYTQNIIKTYGVGILIYTYLTEYVMQILNISL